MKYTSVLLLAALIWAGACNQPEKKATILIESIEGPRPYSSLEVNNNTETFQFAIVTDRTGGHRGSVFETGLSKLNLLQPEFVMSVGDLIEGYTEDPDRLNAEWTEFKGFIDTLKVPFFYVPGNHDITNKVMYDKWKELFGKDYYHFVYKDVLFLCLNSEDHYRGSGKGSIGDEQYAWIEKILAENAEVKWTLVFMHQPLWNQEDPMRWPDVEKLLAPRKHTVYVGHNHRYVKYERNNGKYFVLATTGGGSELRGLRFGEFDHVAWITMTDQGPIMANLLLSGIWDEDVVTEKTAKYYQPLFNGQPVRLSPIFMDGAFFNSGTTEMQLTNNSDAPINVSLEFAANPALIPSFIKKNITVAPNSLEKVPVVIKAGKAPLASLEPLELSATVTFKGDGMPELVMDAQQIVKPEKKEYLVKAAPKKVDGQLNDWATLPYQEAEAYSQATPFSHKAGKADGSVKFGVSYDDKFLYIGAQIIDDEILATPTSKPFNQDAFQVGIDGRTEGISSYGTSLSGILYIGMSPHPDGAENTSPFSFEKLPEGTVGVTAKTSTGYNTELAIPLSYLSEQQGGNWKTARINVAINDFDNDYSHQTVLWWKPDWRGTENYPGSGTFFKK